MITNEMYQVHFQSIREIYIRLSLLQNYFVIEDGKKVRKFRKVGEIQGNAIGGDINIDANSAIRRRCSINLAITDSSFLISEDSKIWLDKLFRVEIGIKNLITDEIVWFNKGIYAINSPSVKYSATEKTLSLEGLDLMCTFDGTLGGSLEAVTIKIPANTPVFDAVKTIATSFGYISKNNLYIEQNTATIPYELEVQAGDSVYSLLEKIRDLYMDFEMFFDEGGRFIYQKIKSRYVSTNPSINDIVSYSFLEENDLAVDYSIDYNFSNVRNKIIIYGKMLDNGIQVKYILENTDENSPFNINKPMGIIPFVFKDDNIFTEDQAEQRANYEYYLHNNMCEKVNIDLAPLYFLECNLMVEFNKSEINLFGKYLIDSISIPLSHDGNSSLSTHKVYEQ